MVKGIVCLLLGLFALASGIANIQLFNAKAPRVMRFGGYRKSNAGDFVRGVWFAILGIFLTIGSLVLLIRGEK